MTAESEKANSKNPGKKPSYIVYLTIALAICLVPSVGIAFSGIEVSSDSDAAPAPSVTTSDGSPNVNVMKDAGDWFEDHFAWRNEWVTASDLVTDRLLQSSTNENVIAGSDGWLYYGNSLGDYQGTSHLSDVQLSALASKMRQMQDYCTANGASFVFTVAPNKNSLYDANMPYYYRGLSAGEHNLERLKPYLENAGVNYVDLHDHFKSQSATLYHARDSHWNNIGASQAADLLLTGLSKKHPSYAGRAYETRRDYTGDLDKMAYPSATTPEDEYYYSPAPEDSYTYETEIESTFDPFIQTSADGKKGSLLMYRDSFGNALLPFMAENYSSALFTRTTPYGLGIDFLIQQPTDVVVERAERFLPELAEEAPEFPAAYIENAKEIKFTSVESRQEESERDGYTIVSGAIPENMLDDATGTPLLRLDEGVIYEAIEYTDGNGSEMFQAVIPDSVLKKTTGNFELGFETND